MIGSKLPGVGTTIFTIMSKMAADEGAINLSQGYPDFNPPDALLDLLAKYARGNYHQYPPMAGVAYLREQIAAKTHALYGREVSADNEVTVTSGGTEAIFVALQALIHPGEECIILDPAFDSYEPGVTMAGGRSVHVPMRGDDFHIDWDEVRAAITPRTRVIIVNSPHNPTGRLFLPEDFAELTRIALGNDLVVISDEVYEHMVYDGAGHTSVLTIEALRDRSIVVSSFGKTCHATGWKVAYAIASPELTDEFRKVHQFVTFTTHTPTQWALAEFLDKHPEHYRNLPDFYQAKRDVFNTALEASAFTIEPSAGTYFQLAGYASIADVDDVTMAHYLTRTVKVAAIPISVFYDAAPGQRVVRLCFAKDDATLREAASRLSAVTHIE